MLPLVCSAAPGCSSQFPVQKMPQVDVQTYQLDDFYNGYADDDHQSHSTRTFSLLWRSSAHRYIVEDRVFLGNQDGIQKHEVFFKPHGTRYLHSLVVETPDCVSSIDSSIFSPYPNDFDDIVRGFSNENSDSEPEKWSCLTKEIYASYPIDADLHHAETSLEFDSVGLMVSNGDNAASGPTSQSIIAEPFESQNVELKPPAPHSTNALLNLQASPSEAENVLSESEMSRSFSVSDSNVNIIPENTGSVSDTLEASKDEVSKLKENAEHLLSGILDSTTTSISKAQTAVEDTYDTFVSSVRKTVNNLSGSLDNATSSFFSSVEKSKEQADSKLTVFSGNFKDSFYGAGNLAIDILRKAIVSFEGLLVNVTSSVVYSYESAKTLLPAEVKDTINTAEAKVLEILMPIGTVFQKVYIVIEGLEKNLGLDPNDPLVQFTLTFISSATLGFSYWILKYGGYSGDLTPGLTLELLKNDDDAVLIDVRPEDLRKRDGVPDLRRKARFKYASVNLPEVASSTRKLLRNIKDVDDALTAAVIRNLKIVQDGSKVIVLDASGDHSKRIARSLRKLGVKKPYLVQGGFRSWVTSGLRAKELKPETTLSVLNEEAEAILEDIRPTPALIFGYGLGAAAVVYALLEWEKTLQLIGVLGLGQTLYRRVASYADSRDLSEDIRLLLYPVRLGAQAFSWATAKLEPNKIGLPTSPSSTAVQDRVLQAAAKHESQPPDADQSQNPSLKVTQKGENLDLSEA